MQIASIQLYNFNLSKQYNSKDRENKQLQTFRGVFAKDATTKNALKHLIKADYNSDLCDAFAEIAKNFNIQIKNFALSKIDEQPLYHVLAYNPKNKRYVTANVVDLNGLISKKKLPRLYRIIASHSAVTHYICFRKFSFVLLRATSAFRFAYAQLQPTQNPLDSHQVGSRVNKHLV